MTQAGTVSGVPGIRYVNVGVAFTPTGEAQYLDLLVSNHSSYTPHDASLNVLNGQFANINLACNHEVTLRATTMMSCATASSCKLCDAMTAASRGICYRSGCSCFGTTVYAETDCTGDDKDAYRRVYSCPALNNQLRLPGETMVTMTVFDFDTGPAGDYVEEFDAPGYAYYKTPLRPASDNAITSSISVDPSTGSFRATEPGDVSDNPTDPRDLTDAQASKGLQLFFRAQRGYIEGSVALMLLRMHACT